MRYLLMIYWEPEADTRPDPGMMERYFAFNAAADEAGVYRAGDALHGTETATTVRVRDGEVFATDGPFAETREQLGGFYIVDCEDLDAAIHWASQIPHAARGSIEVRPIMELPMRPPVPSDGA